MDSEFRRTDYVGVDCPSEKSSKARFRVRLFGVLRAVSQKCGLSMKAWIQQTRKARGETSRNGLWLNLQLGNRDLGVKGPQDLGED